MEREEQEKSTNRVVLAGTAGFCFGVDRAVSKVYELVENGESPVYTLGPIIHNAQVVGDLEGRGVRVIEASDLPTIPQGTVVIRSHGVGRAVYEAVEKAGHKLVDATCPFVRKIHRIVSQEGEKGNWVIIIGNPVHPEVEGIIGWCTGGYSVLQNVEQARNYPLEEGKNYSVVSQTTFQVNKFQDMVEILEQKSYDIEVLETSVSCNIFQTICSATEARQREARLIAAEADTMLVIGDERSSNTQKLYEICKGECNNTYYIHTPVDLDSDMFQCSSYVGITAGASTPKKIIEEVHYACQKRLLTST